MRPASIDDRTLPPLFDIGMVWAILWGRRVMVLAIAGAALLLTIAYLAVTSPSYTATASILIDPRDSRATNFNNVLPGIGSDSAAIASQVFVIESQDLLGPVFDSQGLQNDPEFSGRGLVSRLFSVFGSSQAVSRDAAFKRFQKSVTVDREGLTYVINISVTSQSPDKAARIANAIVDRYKAGLSGERETANSDVNSLLNDRIAGLQKNVSDAEHAVEDFKVQHNIVNSTDGGTLQSQLDQLTTQLITAQGDADQAKDRYNQAVAAGTSPAGLAKLSEILFSNSAVKLRDDYNQRATELANLETMYGPRHPAIARLKSEMDRMSRLMAAEADRIRQQLKASYDLAAQNVGKLQDKLNTLRQQSTDQNLAQVQLRQLDSKAQAARTVLDDFLKRAQETSQMQGVQTSEARTINAATPPVQPTWPKPALLLPVSAVLGLMAGCGLALAFGPVRRPEEDPQSPPEEIAPAMGPEENPARAISRTVPAPANFGDYRLPGVAGGTHSSIEFPQGQPEPAVVSQTPDERLVPATGPMEDTAHMASRTVPMPADFGEYRLPGVAGGAHSSIRAMRTALFQDGNETLSRDVLKLMRRIILRLNDHPKPFVLLVSSMQAGVEARLASAMVGISLQRVDQNVLVIDIDGQPNRPGLFIDSASGLRTIICGSAAQERPEVPGLHTVRGILAEAGSAFDFVVIIAPAFSENGWRPELFARADLALVALRPSEPASQAAELLEQHLGIGQIGRSATLVIEDDGTALADTVNAMSPEAGQWRRSSGARS
ncbi:Wzz/FepE/Etk N-terminal domain-containing protein [Mesorhizobium sp.]|uniref:Wzz/FepE/Etk N-terminal domain-containing protein n=1 Tax=Mesorhizobium sp. TaxID=1871066 RepID=UPI003BAD8268